MTNRVLCKYFAQGACRKGDACPFSHDWKDKPTMVCAFYLKGVCSYGDKCRYDHVKPRQSSVVPPSLAIETALRPASSSSESTASFATPSSSIPSTSAASKPSSGSSHSAPSGTSSSTQLNYHAPQFVPSYTVNHPSLTSNQSRLATEPEPTNSNGRPETFQSPVNAASLLPLSEDELYDIDEGLPDVLLPESVMSSDPYGHWSNHTATMTDSWWAGGNSSSADYNSHLGFSEGLMSDEDADFARDAADFAAHASALRLGLFHLMEESPTAGHSSSHFADSSLSMGSSSHSSYGATAGWGDVNSGQLPGQAASSVAVGGLPGVESGGFGVSSAASIPGMVPVGKGGAGGSGVGAAGTGRVSAAGVSGLVGLGWSHDSSTGIVAGAVATVSGHAAEAPAGLALPTPSLTAGRLSSSATASGRAVMAVSGSSSAGATGVSRARSGIGGSGSGSGSGGKSSGAAVLGVKVGGLWVPTAALAASGVVASHIAAPSFGEVLDTGGGSAASGGVAAASVASAATAAAARPAWGSGSSHSFLTGTGAASTGAGLGTSTATSAGSSVTGQRSLLGSTAAASASAVTMMTGLTGAGGGGGQYAVAKGGADRPLCSMAAAGGCSKGEACTMLHGDVCPHCGRMCLHPYRPQEREEHIESCRRTQSRLRALQSSADIECSVCLEKVLSKGKPSERKFGILSHCDHPFCISCIRSWRAASIPQEPGHVPSVALDLENAVRACPVCRVRSHYVTPSVVWFFSPEEKQAIVGGYKHKLKDTDCRYFNFGEGKCPFGTSCFYKHAYRDGRLEEVKMRHLSSGDGNTVIAREIRLSDFLSTIQGRS